MGTNFYLHEKPVCPACGHDPSERLHIGKSSSGWCFSLKVIPEEGINSLADWQARWSKPGARIVDEYGQEISAEEMHSCITERSREEIGWSKLPMGYTSWEYFHLNNHSEFGPRGLLRHCISQYCIGHGEGTWDLIVGDFS